MTDSNLVLQCVFRVAAKIATIATQVTPVAPDTPYILREIDFVAGNFLSVLADLFAILDDFRFTCAALEIAS